MATQTETTSGQKRQRPLWLKVLLGLIVLGVLYFLSFGPVEWLESRDHLKKHRRISIVIRIFYKPLIWAYYHTPLHTPIEVYAHLWQKPGLQKDK